MVPTWCRGRERNVRSRAGRAGSEVGASGPAPAPHAEQGIGALAGEEVPRIKLRKQGVSKELEFPCGFSLWLLMFRAL